MVPLYTALKLHFQMLDFSILLQASLNTLFIFVVTREIWLSHIINDKNCWAGYKYLPKTVTMMAMTKSKLNNHKTNQGSGVLHEAKIINAFVLKQLQTHHEVLTA